jgi:hypothetical protein
LDEKTMMQVGFALIGGARRSAMMASVYSSGILTIGGKQIEKMIRLFPHQGDRTSRASGLRSRVCREVEENRLEQGVAEVLYEAKRASGKLSLS